MDNSRFERLALLITGSAAFAMMGAGLSLYGPSVLSFQRIFTLSVAQAGWVLSAHWMGSLAGVLAMFFFPGRVGPRPGLALLALGTGLLGGGLSWWATLAGAAVMGLGYGSLTAVFNPRILAAFGARGPAMLSLINAMFSLGAILAPLAIMLVPDHAEKLFLGLAVLTLLVLLASGPAARAAGSTAAVGSGFRLRLPILILGMLAIGLEVSLVGLGPAALVKSGVTEASAARLLSAFYFTFLLGRVALVFIAHRIPDFAVFLGGVALAALALLGCALISPAWFFAPVGLAAGLFFPGFYVTGTRQLGADPRVSPFLIITCQFGAMILPLVLAQMLEPMGTRGFFYLTAGLAAALTLASAALYGRMRK